MKEGTHSMMTRHYKVAGHTFAVSSQAGFFELMGNYEPFECVENRAKSKGYLICSKDCREGRIIMMSDISTTIFEHLLILMYALATAGSDTLVLHAVVVSCEGKGYLFLGPSETGKSTHARMWLLNVEGTKLVNDDFPVVRDGVVYGSPWGGFLTSCYRNVSYPIGGMVRLSQAPHFEQLYRRGYRQGYAPDKGQVGTDHTDVASGVPAR